MTTNQIILIKNSWKKLRHVNAAIIGDLFYSKLFFDNPRLKKMFTSPMEQQNKKLIDMLDYIVSRADNFENVKAGIEAMAIRHAGYGVKPEHYDMVGAALIWTLEKAIGKEWDENLKSAWFACYTLLAQTMIDAVKNAAN